jgi:two-component system, OmpR family, phosphate regulon sensor histidine kinase PhoR
MTATSRRIYLYWLLLIVAALGVGGGAWMLLRREEARLALRASSTEAARRAAVEARARLVAENVELLVGDMQTGLLDALVEAPQENLDTFLDDWEKSSPLVRTAFRATLDGRLLRPVGSAADEEARAFRRRVGSRLLEAPPWREDQALGQALQQQELLANDRAAEESRRQVESNVANFQQARKEVQALSNRKVSPARSSAPQAASSSLKLGKDGVAERETRDAAVAPMAERRGWLSLRADGRIHLLGWAVGGASGEARGVEVELAALIARLGGALPAEVDGGEGYVLRDEKERVVHQAGVIPRGGEPVARVPLSAELLPGWDVLAYVTYSTNGDSSGGFFVIGLLLTGVLVAAILAGGSLLLLQARRSEAEAVQKTSFVANVSHEFKTPLTTIRLYAELLAQGRVPEGTKQTEYLNAIGRETQRLSRLVGNVLDFSRLEQGRKKFQRESIDLAAEVARLLDTHAPRIADAGLALERDLPSEPLTVTTDREAIEQIVLNLVDNACKYATSGGEVAVSLRAGGAGRTVELRVRDRGPGVPAAERERIFEKFHRVDDTLTAEKGGAGLGLSIARQLASGIGGTLRCAAREGGGADFLLELPL